MVHMDAAGFQHATGVSRETIDRLEAYVALLHRWQPKINLVANSTLHDLWERHLLDSAQLAPQLPDGPVVLGDFGAGAGLPGLILAILRPDLEAHLIEVDARKCVFLQEAARAAGVEVQIHRERIESVALPTLTVATARALSTLTKTLDQVAPHLGSNGDSPGIGLFHKGRKWAEELTVAQRHWKMQVDALPSITDPAARILRIHDLTPRDPANHPDASSAAGSQEQK
jgi:16S rRNA (guanine527-N7)-methyltransferase